MARELLLVSNGAGLVIHTGSKFLVTETHIPGLLQAWQPSDQYHEFDDCVSLRYLAAGSLGQNLVDLGA
jgi:hypothetical protein